MTDNGQTSIKESSFIVAIDQPQGTAPNLIVLVHGCCTNPDHVRTDWYRLANKIVAKLLKSESRRAWEIVVWDWSHDTPGFGLDFQNAALIAYENALHQGPALANAIANIGNHRYNHIHLIGHSAGAKLIQLAAEELTLIYKLRNEQPFIHLTFLDAFTPFDMDVDSYGFLANYPRHFSEHYVDRHGGLICLIFSSTDKILPQAFNFVITGWKHALDLNDPCDHQWPRRWYEKSVISSNFRYGYNLSLEGGKYVAALPKGYPPGNRCSLKKAGEPCVPK